MKIHSQRDFWAGTMFFVVGAVFAAASTLYSFGSSARPGPGYFPFGLGILLAILGAIVAFAALAKGDGDADAPIGRVAWRPLLIIIASIVVFGAALPRLGMVITLPLLIIIAAFAGDEFKWKEAIVNSIVLTVASWVIFIWGLGLIIPLWPTFLAGTAG
jgi:hypothetical protein